MIFSASYSDAYYAERTASDHVIHRMPMPVDANTSYLDGYSDGVIALIEDGLETIRRVMAKR